VLDDERPTTAVGFWRRALAFYTSRGIRVERLLTDTERSTAAPANDGQRYPAGSSSITGADPTDPSTTNRPELAPRELNNPLGTYT
jgi:hypothetical protein